MCSAFRYCNAVCSAMLGAGHGFWWGRKWCQQWVSPGCEKPRNRVWQVLMTRPREEWRQDVASRYRALEQFSKEDARLQFLRILRSLPYGNSIFFQVGPRLLPHLAAVPPATAAQKAWLTWKSLHITALQLAFCCSRLSCCAYGACWEGHSTLDVGARVHQAQACNSTH
jgi:hypothetical protein